MTKLQQSENTQKSNFEEKHLKNAFTYIKS